MNDMPATRKPLAEAELYSTAEAASWLGVHPSTIARWVQAGRLTPFVRARGKRGVMLFTGAAITALESTTA